MAITFANAVTAAIAGGTSTTASIAVTAGDIILVGLQVFNGNGVDPPTCSGISGLGLTFTQQAASGYDLGSGSFRERMYVFAAYCPANTSGTITIALANTATRVDLLVDRAIGAVPGLTALIQSATAVGSSSTATAALPAATAQSSNGTWAFLGHGVNATWALSAVTQTYEFHENSQGAVGGYNASPPAAGATGNGTSGPFFLYVVEVSCPKLKAVGGSITPSGSLFKLPAKFFSGVITPTGTLTSLVGRTVSMAGSITPSGALLKSMTKTFAGSITPTGTLVATRIRTLIKKMTEGTLNLIRGVDTENALTLTPESEDSSLSLIELDEEETGL